MRAMWRTGVVLGAMISGACGGGSPSTDAPPESAAPAGTTAVQSSRRNACDFVDRAAIEAMAGKPLTMLHDVRDEDETACELTDPDSKILMFEVKVLWKGGREQARLEQAAVSMAKQALNDEDTDILELTGSENVRGLADKAFYSNVMPSWVLKGDVMVQTIAPTFGYEHTKKAFLLTAKRALAALGGT